MTMEHYIALGASFIDMDDTLEHYGVKGMKWGKNRNTGTPYGSGGKRNLNKAVPVNEYTAKFVCWQRLCLL